MANLDLIEQAKETLRNAGYFGITWTLSDIIERAKSDGYHIDESQAREIADGIENNHDANIGINWENISFHIREFAEENSLPELEFIEFEGENYPTRTVMIAEKESVRISVQSLNNAIQDDEGAMGHEGLEIDSMIYFYVEDDQINLPEKELALIIIEGTI